MILSLGLLALNQPASGPQEKRAHLPEALDLLCVTQSSQVALESLPSTGGQELAKWREKWHIGQLVPGLGDQSVAAS